MLARSPQTDVHGRVARTPFTHHGRARALTLERAHLRLLCMLRCLVVAVSAGSVGGELPGVVTRRGMVVDVLAAHLHPPLRQQLRTVAIALASESESEPDVCSPTHGGWRRMTHGSERDGAGADAAG